MLDRWLYNFFGKMDNVISSIETYAIKLTEWCWQSRIKLLKKKRKKNERYKNYRCLFKKST